MQQNGILRMAAKGLRADLHAGINSLHAIHRYRRRIIRQIANRRTVLVQFADCPIKRRAGSKDLNRGRRTRRHGMNVVFINLQPSFKAIHIRNLHHD